MDNNHCEGCNCTYCDEEKQKEFKILLNDKKQTIPELMCCSEQTIHTFINQSKDDVKKLLEDEIKRKTEDKAGLLILNVNKEPKLAYEKESSEVEVKLRSVDGLVKSIEDTTTEHLKATWRKLSGVLPESYGMDDTKSIDLMADVLKAIQKKFASLKLDWSDEGFFKVLLINQARTNIKQEYVYDLYGSLKLMFGEHESIDFVAEIIGKKLASLFS
jgi:hypothetical protein